MNTQGVAPWLNLSKWKGKLHKNNVLVCCCSWKGHIPQWAMDDYYNYMSYRLTTVLCLGQHVFTSGTDQVSFFYNSQ